LCFSPSPLPPGTSTPPFRAVGDFSFSETSFSPFFHLSPFESQFCELFPFVSVLFSSSCLFFSIFFPPFSYQTLFIPPLVVPFPFSFFLGSKKALGFFYFIPPPFSFQPVRGYLNSAVFLIVSLPFRWRKDVLEPKERLFFWVRE